MRVVPVHSLRGEFVVKLSLVVCHGSAYVCIKSEIIPKLCLSIGLTKCCIHDSTEVGGAREGERGREGRG